LTRLRALLRSRSLWSAMPLSSLAKVQGEEVSRTGLAGHCERIVIPVVQDRPVPPCLDVAEYPVDRRNQSNYDWPG